MFLEKSRKYFLITTKNQIILPRKVIRWGRNYFPSLCTLSSQVCIPLNKRLIYYDNDPAHRSLCGPIINSNDKLITSGSSRTFIILFITSILTRSVEQRGRANNSWLIKGKRGIVSINCRYECIKRLTN